MAELTPTPRLTARNQLLARVNRGIAIALWILIGLCFGIQLLSNLRPPNGHLQEPYLSALGMLLIPFALVFHTAAFGWRQQTRWSWIARTAPLWALVPLLKWCP